MTGDIVISARFRGVVIAHIKVHGIDRRCDVIPDKEAPARFQGPNGIAATGFASLANARAWVDYFVDS